jgi:hypothetical protein
MFYAASEIVFWILLSAVAGGGIGYGLNEARSIQLGRRLSESRADAPMERELAIAWDTIEDLNRRLQVAHETIRGGITDESAVETDLESEVESTSDGSADDSETDAAPEAGGALAEKARAEEDGESEDDDAETDSSNDDELIPFDSDPGPAASLVHTVEQVVSADELAEDTPEAGDNAVGARLSERVASASIGNQVEVVKTVEF